MKTAERSEALTVLDTLDPAISDEFRRAVQHFHTERRSRSDSKLLEEVGIWLMRLSNGAEGFEPGETRKGFHHALRLIRVKRDEMTAAVAALRGGCS